MPIEYSVSSKVHEYGGGAAAINRDGCLIFTDSNTSGVFRYKSEDDIQPIVEADNKLRYADFDSHPKDTKWVLAIQEDHRGAAVENRVVLINSETKTTENLCTGADFYSHPKFSHDGRWVSWIQWRHPDMPWTGSWLCIATWLNGKIGSPKFVAGKAEKESIAQPRWHTYGGLMFMSDRTGFYQLYMYEPRTGEVRPVPVKGYEGVDLTVSKEMPGKYGLFTSHIEYADRPQLHLRRTESSGCCDYIHQKRCKWNHSRRHCFRQDTRGSNTSRRHYDHPPSFQHKIRTDRQQYQHPDCDLHRRYPEVCKDTP